MFLVLVAPTCLLVIQTERQPYWFKSTRDSVPGQIERERSIMPEREMFWEKTIYLFTHTHHIPIIPNAERSRWNVEWTVERSVLVRILWTRVACVDRGLWSIHRHTNPILVLVTCICLFLSNSLSHFVDHPHTAINPSKTVFCWNIDDYHHTYTPIAHNHPHNPSMHVLLLICYILSRYSTCLFISSFSYILCW